MGRNYFCDRCGMADIEKTESPLELLINKEVCKDVEDLCDDCQLFILTGIQKLCSMDDVTTEQTFAEDTEESDTSTKKVIEHRASNMYTSEVRMFLCEMINNGIYTREQLFNELTKKYGHHYKPLTFSNYLNSVLSVRYCRHVTMWRGSLHEYDTKIAYIFADGKYRFRELSDSEKEYQKQFKQNGERIES